MIDALHMYFNKYYIANKTLFEGLMVMRGLILFV